MATRFHYRTDYILKNSAYIRYNREILHVILSIFFFYNFVYLFSQQQPNFTTPTIRVYLLFKIEISSDKKISTYMDTLYVHMK